MAKNKNSSFSVLDGFDFNQQMEDEKNKEQHVLTTANTEESMSRTAETDIGTSSDAETQIVDVMPKGQQGRPKLYEEETKFISCRLKKSNYEYARINGGRFGGVTGYINYLIEKDRGLR